MHTGVGRRAFENKLDWACAGFFLDRASSFFFDVSLGKSFIE